jgi:hypothetical protein
MRHLFLVLMIALLPLRGWVGDVMATEMASPRAAQLQLATEMIAADAHVESNGGHFDHAAMAAGPAQAQPDCAGHGAGDASATADAHCDSCTLCQACHNIALSPAAPAALPVLARPAPAHSPLATFASADSALGQKPPIS